MQTKQNEIRLITYANEQLQIQLKKQDESEKLILQAMQCHFFSESQSHRSLSFTAMPIQIYVETERAGQKNNTETETNSVSLQNIFR